ncbi:MAG: transposase [Deltaproteobacteria bacterium]|nr:transposase [Deltaproteobacteria bacterium]
MTYMARMPEGVIAFVDPSYTSQLCSRCGEYVPKDLAERVHTCSHYGLVLDRDVNAARVILRKGIVSERLESTPVGDSAYTMGKPMMQAESMKQGSLPL